MDPERRDEHGDPAEDDPGQAPPSGGWTLARLAVVMVVVILALAALATWASQRG